MWFIWTMTRTLWTTKKSKGTVRGEADSAGGRNIKVSQFPQVM